MMRAVVLVIIGCASLRDPLEHPTAADLQPIEQVPGLAQLAPERAQHDCRLSSVVRTRFAGQRVIACGAVTEASGRAAWERTGRCLGAAVRDRLPFVAEQQEEGPDSQLRLATVGVFQGKEYVVYRLSSDSDPCGGACVLEGIVHVQRCAELLSAKGGCSGADCAGCGDWVPEEPCRYVDPPGEPTIEEELGAPSE